MRARESHSLLPRALAAAARACSARDKSSCVTRVPRVAVRRARAYVVVVAEAAVAGGARRSDSGAGLSISRVPDDARTLTRRANAGGRRQRRERASLSVHVSACWPLVALHSAQLNVGVLSACGCNGAMPAQLLQLASAAQLEHPHARARAQARPARARSRPARELASVGRSKTPAKREDRRNAR